MADQSERPVLVREEDGPFLLAALFCEKVLMEQDGVVSLIRVVDRVIAQASGIGVPEKMPTITWATTLFIGLKSGFARGSYSVNVKLTTLQAAGPISLVCQYYSKVMTAEPTWSAT